MTGKDYQDQMKKISNRLSKAKVSVKKENEPLFQKFLADAKAHGINVKSKTWKKLLTCVFNLTMIPGIEDYTLAPLEDMLHVAEQVDPKTGDATKMRQVMEYADRIVDTRELEDIPKDVQESFKVVDDIFDLKLGECAGYENAVLERGGKVNKKEDLKFEYFEVTQSEGQSNILEVLYKTEEGNRINEEPLKEEENRIIEEDEKEENKINEEPPKEEENRINEEPPKNEEKLSAAEEKKYQEEKKAFLKMTAEKNWDPRGDEKAIDLLFRRKYSLENIDLSKETDPEKKKKLKDERESYQTFLGLMLDIPAREDNKYDKLKYFGNYFKGTSLEEEYKEVLREYAAREEQWKKEEKEKEQERKRQEQLEREKREEEKEKKRQEEARRKAEEIGKATEERKRREREERKRKDAETERRLQKEIEEEKNFAARLRKEYEANLRREREEEEREEREKREALQKKENREKEIFSDYKKGSLTRAQYELAVVVAEERLSRFTGFRAGDHLEEYEKKARKAGIDAYKPGIWQYLCSICAVGSIQEGREAPVSFQEVLSDLGEKGSLNGVGYFNMLRRISRSVMKNLDYVDLNDPMAAPLDFLNAPIKIGGKKVEVDELIDFEIKYIEPELKKELEEKKKLLKKEEQGRKEDEKEKQPKKSEQAKEPQGMLEADVPLEVDNRINEEPVGERERAAEIAKNYDYLVAMRSDMRGQLLAMRNTLLNEGCKDKKGYAKMLADFNRKAEAQHWKPKDRERKMEAAKAKFFADDGTSYYRNMAKAMNDCISFLDKGDKGVDFDRMRRAFAELLDNVTEYRRVRTRLIHNTRFTEYGEARQETAKTLEKLINSFAVEYRYYSNELKALSGSHSIGGYEKEAIEAKRQYGIETLVPDEAAMADLHRVSAVRAEFVLKLESTCPEVAGLYKLYNTRADLNAYLSDKDNHPNSIGKKAAWYEAKKEYDRFFAPDLTGKQAEEMLRSFDVVAFKARINALKADRAFTDVMNQYGNVAFTCWQGAERAVAGEGIAHVDSEALYQRKMNAARAARPKDQINLHQQVPGEARDLVSPNLPDMTPHGKVQDIQSPAIPNMAYGKTKDIQSPL